MVRDGRTGDEKLHIDDSVNHNEHFRFLLSICEQYGAHLSTLFATFGQQRHYNQT